MSSAFVPTYSLIDDIEFGVTTEVTFTADCDFTDGEIVSFRVSPQSGTFELNNKQARVLSHTSDTITVDIDSNNFTPFISLSENAQVRVAMVVPVGSGIVPGTYTPAMSLADVFDNVPTN